MWQKFYWLYFELLIMQWHASLHPTDKIQSMLFRMFYTMFKHMILGETVFIVDVILV